MALETVVFQQDPFSHSSKDFYTFGSAEASCYGYVDAYDLSFQDHKANFQPLHEDKCFSGYWDSPPSSAPPININSSSQEEVFTGDGSLAGNHTPAAAPVSASSRRKRRRIKSFKNKEEIENQRMTHIAVERNRRKQMNEYLAVLRSLMPPSYAQRGDQASIVGGAINFVKELEQLLQVLEGHKQVKKQRSYADHRHHHHHHCPDLFSNFFTFPQYSTRSMLHKNPDHWMAEKQSTIADIEVSMAESHANIKVLSRKQPKQLFKLVAGFYSLGLSILHLNLTTVDQMILYSFSVKVEEDCQLSTVNEIAATVHEMMGKIQ
ncbi:transcription factor bHLH94-like [Diospyros lotus]|uniref:transcription factor bHLH94-like n=1 Tax=Diospyros lotus TaxID=55363 RepID=UPI00225BAD38|nr:transcription factor bHLH94-like [Diospyros lotus]